MSLYEDLDPALRAAWERSRDAVGVALVTRRAVLFFTEAERKKILEVIDTNVGQIINVRCDMDGCKAKLEDVTDLEENW